MIFLIERNLETTQSISKVTLKTYTLL